MPTREISVKLKSTAPSVAIVYDWLTVQHGGAERVVRQLQHIFPQAKLYSPLVRPDLFPNVETSFLSSIPLLARWYRLAMWILPLAVESMPQPTEQIVISVSSFAAKGVVTQPDQLHISYILSPPRFQTAGSLFSQFLKFALSLVGMWQYLTRWDVTAAHRPDQLIPISRRVAGQIEYYYQRQPEPPIYPTVGLHAKNNKISPLDKREHWLVVSRLLPYKKIDLAIRAAAELQQPLVVVGSGPDNWRLRIIAALTNAPVEFKQEITDEQLALLYQHAKGLLMVGEEDFGIVALEALSHGTPVVINQKSGAAELIEEFQTGVYIESQTLASVLKAMADCERTQFKIMNLQRAARGRTAAEFATQFLAKVEQAWRSHH